MLVSYLSSLMPLPLQGSTDLDHIQVIKKVGGKLTDSYLDEGWCYFSTGDRQICTKIEYRIHFGQVDWNKLPQTR
jgi:hypothetical protein